MHPVCVCLLALPPLEAHLEDDLAEVDALRAVHVRLALEDVRVEVLLELLLLAMEGTAAAVQAWVPFASGYQPPDARCRSL